MLLHAPASLDELLLLFAPCFTKPTFQTFRALVLGQVSQTRLRCVTGMLTGARLSAVCHHARARRFFSDARGCVDELSLTVAELIAERLRAPGQSLTVPIDDTLLRRRGSRTFATGWHHDATANSRRGTVAWGNNWVMAGINVELPFLERTVCLLVAFRLRRPRRREIPKHKSDPERPSKRRLARQILRLPRACRPA